MKSLGGNNSDSLFQPSGQYPRKSSLGTRTRTKVHVDSDHEELTTFCSEGDTGNFEMVESTIVSWRLFPGYHSGRMRGVRGHHVRRRRERHSVQEVSRRGDGPSGSRPAWLLALRQRHEERRWIGVHPVLARLFVPVLWPDVRAARRSLDD